MQIKIHKDKTMHLMGMLDECSRLLYESVQPVPEIPRKELLAEVERYLTELFQDGTLQIEEKT